MSLREKIIAKIDEWDANVPDGPEELADMIIALIGEALPSGRRNAHKTQNNCVCELCVNSGFNDYRQAMLEILEVLTNDKQ